MSSLAKERPTYADARIDNGSRDPYGSLWLWMCVTLACSLLLRFSLFDFESGDYCTFLSGWYDHFVEHGRWRGVGESGENFRSYCYPPLYLYLISLSTLLPLPKLYAVKLISVAGDYVAAWYLWRLVRGESARPWQAWAAMTTFLFLPSVVANSAMWGQCDILYTIGFLASLFYMLEKRPLTALVAFGFSCSLKPQAIFWCPFLLGLFVSGRLLWKAIWIPIGVYVASGVPAVLAGRPILDVLFHWGSFMLKPLGMTVGAANWYQWLAPDYSETLFFAGVTLAIMGTSIFAFWIGQGPRIGLNECQWLVSFALLSVLFPPFFLPGVHERYFFAADVISIVYAFYVPGRWAVPVLVQFASAFSYVPYLFGNEPIPGWALALGMAVAIGLVVLRIYQSFKCSRAEQPRGSA